MEKINAKKLNMTQVFGENGKVIPVTVLKVEGQIDDLDVYKDKEIVVTGKSKGKGFTGVMKKWHFKGQMATRGQADTKRAPGSIGSQTPGRVRKGKKMAGRKGGTKVTIKGLKVIETRADKNELLVSGSVPGPRNNKITIKVL